MKFCQTTTNLKLKYSKFFIAICCVAFAMFAQNASANTYFDVNNATAGFGLLNGGSYFWDDPNWTSSSAGTTATFFYPGTGTFPRFTPPASSTITVTVTNDEHLAGLFTTVSTMTMIINSANGGFLDIDPGDQGFLLSGTLIINAPIAGTGGLGPENNSSGTIKLFGNNSYSGGTPYGYSGAPLTYFNNSNSFGTGPIKINTGQPSGRIFGLLGTGGATITITNVFQIGTANTGFNFAADANTPVTLTGSWTLGANGVLIQNSGGNTSPLTLSGVIIGTGSVTLRANNPSGVNTSTIIVNGASTYSGQTILTEGANPNGVGVTVSVGGNPSNLAFNKVSGGSPSSNLGAPTTIANGTINIGSTVTSTLIYTGAGETSDRVINLAGTTGGAVLQADGTGPLVLTSTNSATGNGTKTLTLQGSNTGANSIGKIVNSTSPTSVVKAQAGRWVLTGANSFTGGTTVNAGTLEISGSVLGNVTVNAGTLTLSNAAAMASSGALTVFSGTTVNLNFAGTNAVNSLVIDGTTQESGVWGPPGSSAPPTHQNSIFAGTGYINVLGTPVITQQPMSGSVFPDATFTFTVGVADTTGLNYQWKKNGANIATANSSSYTISPVEASDAGNYSCWLTNSAGWTNTINATLTVLGTNAYTAVVVADGPVSYWRLGETNGSLAYDAIGGNLGQYVNVALKQPGYALTDPDTSIGLPAVNTSRGYVQVTNYVPFTFGGASAFTLEAWVNFTNVNAGVQRIFSTFSGSSPSWGYAFGIKDPNTLRFTTSTVQDADQSLSHALVAGLWYHIVCTSSAGQYHFYVNGAEAGSGTGIIGSGNTGVSVPLQLGANPGTYPAAEQVNGRIDEVAIYNYALNSTQVTNHYSAAFETLTVSTPVALPPTNYANLSASIQAVATGQGLTYQWYKGTPPGGTALSDGGSILGSSSDTLTISPLSLADGTNYWVQVSNPSSTSNSPAASLVVLPIPSSPSQLNLTNGLVVHLPFDTDYLDISGRANNSTNVNSSYLTNAAAIGTHSLHYFTDTGSSSYNYATLGVRPDLQFSSNVNFTVSFWVRQPAGSTFTNLPFFTDAIGSTAHNGFAFAPYNGTGGGGFIWTIGTVTSPNLATTFPDANLINDGNWHHLVHVADRNANCTTYLDGQQVDSQSIVMSVVGNINTPNAATIGQDPSGTYPVTAEAELDDLGVWRRTLTPLEVSGIYLAGASNSVSFAPVVNNAPAPASTTISNIIGTTLTYGGGAGSQFVLLGTNNIAAPISTWPRLATNSVTPGTFTIPAVGSAAATYYRIKSE
jgi:autotransporter-associated beta strand protein